MSQELQQFYKEILEWVEAGTPKRSIFRKRMGLCGNLGRWLHHNVQDSDQDASIWKEQDELFKDLYGDSQFPFGEEAYRRECKSAAQYKNPKRLAFLRSQVEVDNE